MNNNVIVNKRAWLLCQFTSHDLLLHYNPNRQTKPILSNTFLINNGGGGGEFTVFNIIWANSQLYACCHVVYLYIVYFPGQLKVK